MNAINKRKNLKNPKYILTENEITIINRFRRLLNK